MYTSISWKTGRIPSNDHRRFLKVGLALGPGSLSWRRKIECGTSFYVMPVAKPKDTNSELLQANLATKKVRAPKVLNIPLLNEGIGIR